MYKNILQTFLTKNMGYAIFQVPEIKHLFRRQLTTIRSPSNGPNLLAQITINKLQFFLGQGQKCCLWPRLVFHE